MKTKTKKPSKKSKKPKTTFEHVGDICVDSGQVWIGDPCHLDGGAIPSKNVVIVQTAYGDGFYPVFAEKDQEGRVLGLMINLNALELLEDDSDAK